MASDLSAPEGQNDILIAARALRTAFGWLLDEFSVDPANIAFSIKTDDGRALARVPLDALLKNVDAVLAAAQKKSPPPSLDDIAQNLRFLDIEMPTSLEGR